MNIKPYLSFLPVKMRGNYIYIQHPRELRQDSVGSEAETFLLKVDLKQESIASVKAKIQREKGIPLTKPELYFQKQRLKNDHTLDYYRIQDYSVLILLPNDPDGHGTTISVQTLTGKTLKIESDPLGTVHQLKDRIWVTEGIPSDQQRLVCGGRQMEEDRTLDHYNIQKDTLIHLILRLRGGGGRFTIAVEKLDGEPFLLRVSSQDPTISEIRDMINEKQGIHPSQQRLVFGGLLLDDDRTVGSYGIKELAVLNLVPSSSSQSAGDESS